MAKPDGGPAFPQPERSPDPDAPNDERGMSLRDYFAAMAIAGQAHHQGFHPAQIKDAYAIADAMLAERKK